MIYSLLLKSLFDLLYLRYLLILHLLMTTALNHFLGRFYHRYISSKHINLDQNHHQTDTIPYYNNNYIFFNIYYISTNYGIFLSLSLNSSHLTHISN